MNNKIICLCLLLLTCFNMTGEIIDYSLTPLPTGESEERVLLDRNQVKEYLKSLDASLSQATINGTTADLFDDKKSAIMMPVEVVTVHSSCDSLFIKDRINFLEETKKDYRFSKDKRIKINFGTEMTRKTVLGTIIFIQTVYFPFRYLLYEDKPVNLLIAGSIMVIDMVLLMIHWQGTQQIYKE